MANRKNFLTYDQSVIIVNSLNLKSKNEWRKFCKSEYFPNNIPKDPRSAYKDEFLENGGMGAWLGTGKISYQPREFLPYNEAIYVIHPLNLKNRREWTKYTKSGKLPINIPVNPRIYKDEFISWGDWLGTGTISTQLKEFLPYNEAIKVIHPLNLESRTKYSEYAKLGKLPDNIPRSPNLVYKDEFISWGDWLGTGRIATQLQHSEFNQKVIDYLTKIKSQLNTLETIELITIIQQSEGGFFYDAITKNSNFKSLIQAKTPEEKLKATDSLIDDLKKDEQSEDTNALDSEIIESDIFENKNETNQENKEDALTKTKRTIEQLESLDDCKVTAILDEEAIKFLEENRINLLWNQFMNDELDLPLFTNKSGGQFHNLIKDRFLSEYKELENWNFREQIDCNYLFEHEPNMMQKLFVKRVIEKKKYGNWSGVGAGKTLAAILATKITKSRNTLIITFNSTTDNWLKEINQDFDNNHVIIKDKDPKFVEGKSNYLILNYEFFQQEDSENVVYNILSKNKIDFIILDEVQLTKQRDESISKRREIILKLISTANPEYQIAMSATPVVNNLYEAKTLLEMLKLDFYNDLETTPTINNALQLHKHLVINGLRYKPKYDISVQDIRPIINGDHLIDELKLIKKGKIIEMENILLKPKLDAIKQYLKKGTIIYSEYVDGMVNVIRDYCQSLGYKVGLYTGDDKTGITSFKNGEIDILIGTRPINTGVDGLQNICDNLIILSLPWTSSDYEQLVGRIYRQGSKFGVVKVIIPIVQIDMLEDGIWSYDNDRLERIKYKKTLSDCAVDGIVPSDKILSQSALFNKAKKSLDDWINRINNGEIHSVDRYKIDIQLKPDEVDILKKKLGDFSELNKKWSTSNSKNTKLRIDNDPKEWNYYHYLYGEARKNWSEIPYIEISKKIKNRPEWIIGDFGCGENLLSKEIPNKVHAFDYVAIDEDVISCDISSIPLGDNTLDVVVFSLSLMGSNYTDYVNEAYRTLKPYGQILIAEPLSKWENRIDVLLNTLEGIGFRCFSPKVTSKFIYIDGCKSV